jgi:hypothetical protein
MDGMKLEPYAVLQSWHLPDTKGQWESTLGEYLQTVAQRCIDQGECVIGHIKALATFSDHKFLRISVITPKIPANIEGEVPANCTELELTVNVLVYGLERDVIEKITCETANEIANRWKGGVQHKGLNQADESLHHNHH